MSLRTRIINKLVAWQMSGWSKGTIEAQRARQESALRYVRLPADVRCRPVSAEGVPAEWIEASGAGAGVLLYLHGGAFCLGSIASSREWVARLARATRMRALAIDYRLAPEHPYPAALDDATTAYLWLLKAGVEPSQIILVGDSAGGGLVLSTLVALRDAGRPLPAGAVCISPWTDLALTGGSIQDKARIDPILSPTDLDTYAGYYVGEYGRTEPLLSPLYADLQGLPPLLIQVGTNETLFDDAVRCADRARSIGVDVTLEIWAEMFHVFQMFPFLTETKRAVTSIADWAATAVSLE
ncbi:MAG: alpha/beta hydrolase [Anaerolineae bacterium]|nr:alpha/beta hydrolase [Anaerolineae bacterium]